MAESLNQTDAELEKKLNNKSKILEEATKAALKLAATKEAALKKVNKNSNEISTTPTKENKDSKNTTSKEDDLHEKAPEVKDKKTKKTSDATVSNKKAEDLKNKIEDAINIENARSEYFKLKSDKTKGKNFGLSETEYTKKLNAAEENYKNTKNKIVQEFLNKREEEKAKGFLFAEVELKRKNDLENKLVGKRERMKAGIAKGIEKWDNFGSEKGPKGIVKRMLKMGINLSLLSIASGFSVENLAKMGIGSASALSGGATSYMARKVSVGWIFGGIISTIPDKHKKWVGAAMMACSIGLAASGGGVVGGAAVLSASLFGLGLSKLTKKYDQKIKNRSEESKTKINLINLENTEKEIEKILKVAETTRILGKVIEAGVALAGSIAFLEVSGAMHDSKQAKIETEHKHQEEIKHEAETKQHEEIKHEQEIKHATDLKHQEEIKHLEISTVHKGEGIEHSFIRQIEHNQDLAKELGFKGDVNDVKALHEFAGREAHIIAIKEGYVDNAEHEVRIAETDKVAYEIKMENGHILVEEKTVTGELLETHHEGDKFEENTDKYEYNDGKDHRLDHQQENINQTHRETDTEKQIINEYEDTSKPTGIEHTDVPRSDQVIEYDDTSKPTGEQHASPDIKTEPLNIKVGEHIYNTEEDWAKAPKNIYHIPLKDLTQINEIHNSNINHITSQTSSEEELQKVQSTLKEGHADAMIGIKETEVNEIYRPIHNYINKLHEVTKLEPIGETHLHAAETDIDYTHRAEMKAAEMHKLDEIKLENTHNPITPEIKTHEETIHIPSEKWIDVPNGKQWGGLGGGEVHFTYDNSGKFLEWKYESHLDSPRAGLMILKNNHSDLIREYNNEHLNTPEKMYRYDSIDHKATGIRQLLNIYENIKENPNYSKESEAIKNTIIHELKSISDTGVIDYNKLPKEFQPK